MNTRISYLCRDVGNYKKHNEVVVPGTFALGQIETITGCRMMLPMIRRVRPKQRLPEERLPEKNL